jgi:hypothetical protein
LNRLGFPTEFLLPIQVVSSYLRVIFAGFIKYDIFGKRQNKLVLKEGALR